MKLGVASAIRGREVKPRVQGSGRESPISPGRRGGETLEGSCGRSTQYLGRTWKGGKELLSWRRKGDILGGGKEAASGGAGKEANVRKENPGRARWFWDLKPSDLALSQGLWGTQHGRL